MPKGSAYDDLTKALEAYEKAGAGERDENRKRREEDEKRKRAQEEERQRLELEGRNATGARVRRGFESREEMREAINAEKSSRQLLKPVIIRRNTGGPRG